jgi:starvation-inducible DNA-binding protein
MTIGVMTTHANAVGEVRHPTLPPSDTELIGEQLQAILVVLTELALTGKHAHWNVAGPRFRPVHLFLDEMIDVWRTHADAVAERSRAVGGRPDGRVATVAAGATLPALDAGRLGDGELVPALAAILAAAVGAIRPRMDALEDVDAVTADLLHGVVASLEEQLWMLRDMVA